MHSFDFEIIWRTLPYVFMTGMAFTLKLTIFATIGAVILGTLLAMMRLSSNRFISGISGGYVNFLRALPLILIIFWFYFLVPYLAGWVLQAGHPISVGGFTSACLTFILFEAAYFCAIMRASSEARRVGKECDSTGRSRGW